MHLEEMIFTHNQTMEIEITTRTMAMETQGSLDQERHTLPTNQSGQASIEFILTFAFGIGMSLLFVSLAINMTRGYLVHYANFMASRTFLSYDSGSTNTVEASLASAGNRARDTFNKYPLASFDIQATFKVNVPIENSQAMSGSTAIFSERTTPLNLVGGTNEATLLSESFLGKEPVRLQCLRSTCGAMGLGGCGSVMDVTVFDNGC